MKFSELDVEVARILQQYGVGGHWVISVSTMHPRSGAAPQTHYMLNSSVLGIPKFPGWNTPEQTLIGTRIACEAYTLKGVTSATNDVELDEAPVPTAAEVNS